MTTDSIVAPRRRNILRDSVLVLVLLSGLAAPVGAQQAAAPAAPPPAAPQAAAPQAAAPTTGTLPVCGGMYQIGPPAKLPPTSLKAVVYMVAACFEKQGGYSVVD